jgi:hypothetical protein
MFTSAECRARAEAILAQAESDGRHRRRLITAAEGWLHLASQLRRVEVVGTSSPRKKFRTTQACLAWGYVVLVAPVLIRHDNRPAVNRAALHVCCLMQAIRLRPCAVATNRTGHRSPESGRAGRRRRWGREREPGFALTHRM